MRFAASDEPSASAVVAGTLAKGDDQAAVKALTDQRVDSLDGFDGADDTFLATSEDAVPEGWAVIGSVAEAGPDGPAVTVDGAAYDGPTGWTHF